jgi:molybdenum cofactor cytidylyltransferase
LIKALKNNNLIGIILLAAGSAKRMKENKLLLKIKGKTLLENALSAAQESKAGFTTTVLGAYAEDILKFIEKYPVGVCLNKNYKDGIGSSIKSGLEQALKDHPETDAIIISVCDQPFLSKEIFNGLIATYKQTGKKIIASDYSDSIGVPVLYHKSLFSDLLNIPDQYGAKKYIIEKADEKIITTFPFPKGEIDIDTLEDLKNLSPRPEGRGN